MIIKLCSVLSFFSSKTFQNQTPLYSKQGNKSCELKMREKDMSRPSSRLKSGPGEHRQNKTNRNMHPNWHRMAAIKIAYKRHQKRKHGILYANGRIAERERVCVLYRTKKEKYVKLSRDTRTPSLISELYHNVQV